MLIGVIWKVMQFPSKKIAAHFGLEVEYPFLNENVKKLAMEIPVELKIKSERNRMYGKWILRKAFEGKISKTLLWRDKTPMGDGSGSAGLIAFFDKFYSDEDYSKKLQNVKKDDDVTLYSKEQLYYYEIFRKHFDAPSKLNTYARTREAASIFHQLVKKSSKTPFCGNFSQCGPCLTLIGIVGNRRNIMRPYFSGSNVATEAAAMKTNIYCRLLHKIQLPIMSPWGHHTLNITTF